MAITQGRNERCNCGSGKKYKYCCHLKPVVQPVTPLASATPSIVWHYTVGACIERILADGELNLSTMAGGREKDILWFSANPDWEPSAGKKLILNENRLPPLNLDRAATARHYAGLYRIGVSPSVLASWAKLKQAAGYKPESIAVLEKLGNPLQWWGSLEKVSSKHWLTIERFNGGWQELRQGNEIGLIPLPLENFNAPTASELSAFWASWTSQRDSLRATTVEAVAE